MAARRVRVTSSVMLFGIALVALLGAVACTLLATPPAAAASSHDGACVGDSGVTVVVDATNVGAGIRVSCALGAQPNGWEALKNAGHTVAPNPNAAAAVCQIDGRPSEGFPTCWETNFWSYHHAPNALPGATWTFSSAGATIYKPGPGSVEGWKYTSTSTQNDPPGAGPVFADAVPPTPPPTGPGPTAPPPTQPPTGGGPTKPGAGPPVASVPPAPAPPGTGAGTATTVPGAPVDVTTTTGPDTAVATEIGSTTTAPRTSDSDASNARALGGVDLSSDTHPSSGIPFAMLAGVALIAAFAASAGVVAYRRRTAASTEG